ncbi:MAG TPA: prenyltransferase/squalene oxidase repeat-containing protein [Thiobacillaceae bacterium]|nr:prenyltransferase/squalene oxidase repeat-containing protein [Thiobacillaceae bacterium]
MRLVLEDLPSSARQIEHDHRTHLRAAIDWLCRAQDVRTGTHDAGGVAAGWSFEDGWLPSYPETTGYIIETFLVASQYVGRPELVERAQRMLDWELSLQDADGAFPGHFGEKGSHAVIFNQGQIMHGLVAGYTQLKRQDCLAVGVRAGRWLAQQQDDDGCYRKFEHNGVPHVYNTRAIWALASIGLLANEDSLVQAARRNLDWALGQQTPSGWYRANAFLPGRDPYTHTIAYAIRGFLESAVLLGEERYLRSAERAARGLMAQQRADGWLAGTYDDGWAPTAGYACVTGVAQMALCWLRLFQLTGERDYRDAAGRAIAFVKRTQRIEESDDILRGAIPGSAPIWGAYSRFEFPNWAAKFFADALMMDMANSVVPPVPAVARGLPR